MSSFQVNATFFKKHIVLVVKPTLHHTLYIYISVNPITMYALMYTTGFHFFLYIAEQWHSSLFWTRNFYESSNKHFRGSKGTVVCLQGQSHQNRVLSSLQWGDFWVARALSQYAIPTDVYFQNIWSPHKVTEGSRTSFELHIRAWPAGGHSMRRQSKAFRLWKTHPLLPSASECVFLILRHETRLQHWMLLQMTSLLCALQGKRLLVWTVWRDKACLCVCETHRLFFGLKKTCLMCVASSPYLQLNIYNMC